MQGGVGEQEFILGGVVFEMLIRHFIGDFEWAFE